MEQTTPIMKFILILLIVSGCTANKEIANKTGLIEKPKTIRLWSKQWNPEPIIDTVIYANGDTLIKHHFSQCYKIESGNLVLSGICK